MRDYLGGIPSIPISRNYGAIGQFQYADKNSVGSGMGQSVGGACRQR